MRKASLLTITILLGCTPGAIGYGEESLGDTGTTGDPTTDTGGDTPAPIGFARVRCVKISNSVDVCFGLPEGSTDAWVPVIQTCDLESLVTSGQYEFADSWGPDSCAAGMLPEFMAYQRCITNGVDSLCFAGDGYWWAPITPACEASIPPASPWPAWICGEQTSIGEHPWDQVGCEAAGPNACAAVLGPDAMEVWPTCYLDSFPSVEPPACLGEPGEPWGPCPIDPASGEPTLCNGEDLACVPADFGEANICLPLGSCPDVPSDFDVLLELGWGNACYPRCQSDADCAAGMVCGSSVADGSPMCAWPRDPCGGGIGCACASNESCSVGLDCIGGSCGPCPAGQLGCACEAGEICDQGLGCAKSLDGSHVCGLLASSDICSEHGIALDLPAVEVDGVCVASCVQGDGCGWLTCSPIDAKAQGFCAYDTTP